MRREGELQQPPDLILGASEASGRRTHDGRAETPTPHRHAFSDNLFRRDDGGDKAVTR
jgi:hypothetical protein